MSFVPPNESLRLGPGAPEDRADDELCEALVRCTHPREVCEKYCEEHLLDKTGRGARPKGRFASSLGPMRESYLASLNDPGLLDLREPIAVMDLCAKRLMERVAEGDSTSYRIEVKKLVNDIVSQFRSGRGKAAKQMIVKALLPLVERGVAEDRAMSDLLKAVDRLSRRIEGAWEIKLAKRNVVNQGDLIEKMGDLLDILRTELEASAYSRVIALVDAKIMRGAGREALESQLGPIEVPLLSDGKDKSDGL